MRLPLLLGPALALLGASIASAAAPGMNLGWNDCSITLASQNYNFSCSSNTLSRRLVASFRLDAPVAGFAATSIGIEYALGSPDTPPWFQFGAGGCREGAIGPVTVGTLTGCANPYATANQAGGMIIDPLGPNRYRIRVDWARDLTGPLSATTLYSGVVLLMNTSGSWDDGFGPVCEGCSVPACFVLKYCEVYRTDAFGTYLAANLSNADVRNWVTYQGGGFGVGCPGETPSTPSTWGALKALYR